MKEHCSHTRFLRKEDRQPRSTLQAREPQAASKLCPCTGRWWDTTCLHIENRRNRSSGGSLPDSEDRLEYQRVRSIPRAGSWFHPLQPCHYPGPLQESNRTQTAES